MLRAATVRSWCWPTCPGFDGSPESLRNIQLEYGAEIGRAIVNFDGPIVFCVVSRYHGGAFVVFSGALNDNMEVLAVEGSFASVLGGAPAAAVVFTREVNTRTNNDPKVQQLEADLAAAKDDTEKAHLRVELNAQRIAVRSDKLGEVASNSKRSTTSSGPERSARWMRSSLPQNCVRRSSQQSNAA